MVIDQPDRLLPELHPSSLKLLALFAPSMCARYRPVPIVIYVGVESGGEILK
jgi:hypothetical protein